MKVRNTQWSAAFIRCVAVAGFSAVLAFAGDLAGDTGGGGRTGDTERAVFPGAPEGMSMVHRQCDGSRAAPPITLRQWRQVYFEAVRAASTDPGRAGVRALRGAMRRSLARGVIPIAILHTSHRIPAADGDQEILPPGSEEAAQSQADREMRTFAAASLSDYTHRGAHVVFTVEDSWIVGNGRSALRRIEIDFADGSGYRAVRPGDRIAVSYGRTGRREIRVRAQTLDGSFLHAGFYFRVEHLRTPMPDDTLSITATIPYNGAYAAGEAYCYLASSHDALENPLIAVEGFDIDNTMNWDELYQHLNQETLLETLRGEGYDLVVLNFTDATDFIQANAFVLVELVSQVTAAIGPHRNLAVVGASMGGLVARYALAYMETQGIDHHTDLLMTLDTPHRGANIPLGIQYWMDFFSGQSEDAAFLLGQLDRPAARQMLVYHHTDPPGTTGEKDSLRAILAADLAAVGDYPALPRTVAVANGSGSGIGQGFAPSEQIIFYEYNSLLVDIVGNVWVVPDGGPNTIFYGLVDMIWPFPDDEMIVSVSGTQPYDCAPGGTRASMAQMDSTEAPYGDIIALHDVHCFIPTVSALDFDSGDLFHDIAGDPDPMSRTPFDTIYYPVENQEHVLITPENADWMMAEIRGAVTAV
ncbi:MAG TPA: hypothetical protein VMX58_00260, partial [Patescibacteria group bacterium]|nr:hypothetical protein [Patescibacteria group bacterium]